MYITLDVNLLIRTIGLGFIIFAVSCFMWNKEKDFDLRHYLFLIMFSLSTAFFGYLYLDTRNELEKYKTFISKDTSI